jgi:hypothetical protein
VAPDAASRPLMSLYRMPVLWCGVRRITPELICARSEPIGCACRCVRWLWPAEWREGDCGQTAVQIMRLTDGRATT